MSKVYDEIPLSANTNDAPRICRQAIAQLGWRVLEQSDTRFVVKEVSPQATSFTLAAKVELVIEPGSGSGSVVRLNGAISGVGPIQKNHLKGQVGESASRRRAKCASRVVSGQREQCRRASGGTGASCSAPGCRGNFRRRVRPSEGATAERLRTHNRARSPEARHGCLPRSLNLVRSGRLVCQRALPKSEGRVHPTAPHRYSLRRSCPQQSRPGRRAGDTAYGIWRGGGRSATTGRPPPRRSLTSIPRAATVPNLCVPGKARPDGTPGAVPASVGARTHVLSGSSSPRPQVPPWRARRTAYYDPRFETATSTVGETTQ